MATSSAASSASRLTIAVDPGTRSCGVAVFEGQTLRRVHLARATGDDFVRRARDVAYDAVEWMRRTTLKLVSAEEQVLYALAGENLFTLVIEFPQVYKHGPGAKVDPDSVLAVATAVGCIIAALPEADVLKTPRPREWKAQLPKDVMHTRIVHSLSAEEKVVLRDAGMAGKVRMGTSPDVLDSVCLGIWAVGRPGRES